MELDPGVADDAADRLGPLQLLQKLLQTSSCRGDRGPLKLPPHPELGSNTMLTYISPNTGSQELSAGICNVFRWWLPTCVPPTKEHSPVPHTFQQHSSIYIDLDTQPRGMPPDLAN